MTRNHAGSCGTFTLEGFMMMRLRTIEGLVLTCVVLAGCPADPVSSGDTEAGTTGGTTAAAETGTTAMMPDPTTVGAETTAGPSDTSTTTGASSSTGEESGSSGTTGEPGGLADIDMEAVVDVMTESAYTQTVTFGEDSCALAEACVDGPGERRLLRFDTWTPNVGETDLIVGNPESHPDLFEFGECHGHYHFLDYASYRLLDAKGEVAATGHKQSFALIDFEKFFDDAGPGQYPLPDGTQGITAGWADIYGAYLDCQWVDITGVTPGEYTLEVHVNPELRLEEASYDNNIALISVTIGKQDDVGPVLPPPKEWTCDAEFYSTDDGCDCGCGAVDPDCDNPTVKACEYCDNNGSCAASCDDINAANNAVCD